MKLPSHGLPIKNDSKYPWGDRFNRLKATEEMRRFAEYILYQLHFDTINTDSDSILLISIDFVEHPVIKNINKVPNKAPNIIFVFFICILKLL